MKKILIFLLSTVIFSLSSRIVQASISPIFFDDFNNIREDWNEMWIGGSQAYNWQIIDGKYGMRINSSSTVYDSVAGDEQWTDYEYEFEMHTVVGTDKNFLFRYQVNPIGNGRNAWYEIHATGSDLYLSKVGWWFTEDLSMPSNLRTPIKVTHPLQNNSVYYWRIRLIGENIQVFVRKEGISNETKVFDIEDNNNFLRHGKIGFRIGTGSVYPTEIYFDNVKVTDLSAPPEPEPLPYLNVPHYSQNDPQWATEEYDLASKWNPSNTGIDRWGCALASAAMILDYHGYNPGFLNQPTNPLHLNNFLNFAKGYQNNGGIIWSYISQYAALTKAFGNPPEDSPHLEFRYEDFDLELLREEANEAKRPAIIKIVLDDKDTPSQKDDDFHFVVAKGVTEEGDVYINDPEDDTGSTLLLSEAYPDKEYRQIGLFVTSQTDLGYIWTHLTNPNMRILVEKDEQKNGEDPHGTLYNEIANAQYQQEGALASVDNLGERYGGDDNGSRIWLLPKPETGDYLYTFSAPSYMKSDFALHTLDATAGAKLFEEEISAFPGWSPQYQLTFNREDSSENTLKRLVSFESLRALIRASYNQGWITRWTSRKYLIKFSYIIEKVQSRNERAGTVLFAVFQKNLDHHYRKKWIVEPAYSLIQTELSLLQSQL